MPTGGWWWCSCHRSLSTDHFTRVADPAKLHNLRSLPYFSLTPAVPPSPPTWPLWTVVVPLNLLRLLCIPIYPCLTQHHVFCTTPFSRMMSFKGLLQEVRQTHPKPSPLASHRLYQSSSNSNSLLGLGGEAWWQTSCLARERPQAHPQNHTHK